MSHTEAVWAAFRESHWWLYSWEHRQSVYWPWALPRQAVR